MHAVCPDIFSCGSICVSPDHFYHWTLQVSLASSLNPTVGAMGGFSGERKLVSVTVAEQVCLGS